MPVRNSPRPPPLEPPRRTEIAAPTPPARPTPPANAEAADALEDAKTSAVGARLGASPVSANEIPPSLPIHSKEPPDFAFVAPFWTYGVNPNGFEGMPADRMGSVRVTFPDGKVNVVRDMHYPLDDGGFGMRFIPVLNGADAELTLPNGTTTNASKLVDDFIRKASGLAPSNPVYYFTISTTTRAARWYHLARRIRSGRTPTSSSTRSTSRTRRVPTWPSTARATKAPTSAATRPPTRRSTTGTGPGVSSSTRSR